MRAVGPGSVSGSWRRAQVLVECSLSPHHPLLHLLPAPPLSSPCLHFRPLSSWHLERALPCRGRGTLSHHRLHRCPLSPGSSLCSGSRCQRGGGTTDGCGRRCLGPSGCGPTGHISIYAGQQTPRAGALIVGFLSQCQPDRHCHQAHQRYWAYNLHQKERVEYSQGRGKKTKKQRNKARLAQSPKTATLSVVGSI